MKRILLSIALLTGAHLAATSEACAQLVADLQKMLAEAPQFHEIAAEYKRNPRSIVGNKLITEDQIQQIKDTIANLSDEELASQFKKEEEKFKDDVAYALATAKVNCMSCENNEEIRGLIRQMKEAYSFLGELPQYELVTINGKLVLLPKEAAARFHTR